MGFSGFLGFRVLFWGFGVFGVEGCRVLGFRVLRFSGFLGFRVLGFRGLGFWGLGFLGFLALGLLSQLWLLGLGLLGHLGFRLFQGFSSLRLVFRQFVKYVKTKSIR